MRSQDMILVSVDDHAVEPPDMFQRALPVQFHSVAPRVVRKKDGSDVWVFDGKQIPNLALNAVVGRPPQEYGMEPTSYDQIRPGCVAMYYPESNVLVPKAADPLSRTPAYKSVAVTIAADDAVVQVARPRPELVAPGTPREKMNQC